MKTLSALCVLCVLCGEAFSATCPTDRFCAMPNAHLPGNSGWNVLRCSPDTGKCYLYANDALSPVTFENAMDQYTVQADDGGDGWDIGGQSVTLSTSGDAGSPNNTTFNPFGTLICSDGFSDTATEATFTTTALTGMPAHEVPQSATVWVGDEAITYSGCDELLPTPTTNSCPVGTTQFKLKNLTRGQLQSIGGRAAYVHPAKTGNPCNKQANGEYLMLAAYPRVTIKGVLQSGVDMPTSRHPNSDYVVDTVDGKLWVGSGYQENFGYMDTWYACIAAKGSCPAGSLLTDATPAGWIHVPVYTNGSTLWDPNIREDARVFDQLHNAILQFGAGGTDDQTTLHVFCKNATTSAAYIGQSGGNTYCNSNSGNANKWFKVTAHGGHRGGDRQKIRAVWDSDHNRALLFGGFSASPWSTSNGYKSVAVYDPATGDWCISDTSQGGSQANASSCPSQFGTNANSPSVTGMGYFPAIDYDSARHKLMYYPGVPTTGSSVIYGWDYTANHWTTYTLPVAGPAVMSDLTIQGSVSMAYEASSDTHVYLCGNGCGGTSAGTWQLAGAALSNVAPSGSTAFSGVTLSGVVIQ